MKRNGSDYEEKMKRFHRACEIQPRLAELEENLGHYSTERSGRK